LGLPLVITFAWYHGEKASRRISGPELTIIALLMVTSSLLFYVFVRPAGEASAPASSVQRTAPAPVGISLAVLPFVNLSDDRQQEFFSDGMTEEITAALAKVPGLRVVARTSAFEFKGKNVDIEKIAAQLHATHLIEGSVRKDGNQVRITAQLIKADDGTHLWTESYDRELKAVFAVQEEIATAIAASLRVPLGLKEGQSLIANRTTDTDSYQDYLRAKSLVHIRALKPMTDAAALLERVVARDLNYAPAWALLAQAYDLVPTYSPARENGAYDELSSIAGTFVPKAQAAAQRAIQLDPNLADAYSSLGRVYRGLGNFLLAEDMFKKALALDPKNPDALYQYSQQLMFSGRLREALVIKQQLQVLEPFVPQFNGSMPTILWLNGQTDAAIAMLKAMPADERGRAAALASIYASMGRYQEGAGALLEIPSGTYIPGIVEIAANILRTAPNAKVAQSGVPNLGNLGFVYLYTDVPIRTLEYYENLARGGDFTVGVIFAQLWHSDYKAVRKTERFKSLIRKLGLVDYWRERGWPDLCHPTTGDDFVCE
jgi:TolB-like protein